MVKKAMSVEEGLDAIKKEIPEYQAVMIGDLPAHKRNVLVKYCFEKNVRCYCQPKISDIMIMGSEKIHLFDTPLLLFRNCGLTVEKQAVKRAFDLVCSVLMLVVLSPVMLLIAALVKGYDGGPVFYRQERLTLNGKSLWCINSAACGWIRKRTGPVWPEKGTTGSLRWGRFCGTSIWTSFLSF